jgi:pimeloyl-ACP methyl ester carboxylesterase
LFSRTRFARRSVLQGLGALFAHSALASSLSGSDTSRERSATDKNQSGSKAKNENVFYGQDTVPGGIRSRFIDNNNGVRMHILEAGFEENNRPCVVFLHGFPELGYTWKNQLLPLAQAGFHVIAPDLRGYGRSVTRPVAFEDDLLPYALLNRVNDVVGLVRSLGYERVAAVVGHDWGAPTAAWCGLVQPRIFRSVVVMSTPFGGAPAGTARHGSAPITDLDINKDLAALPRPRKHYLDYLATHGANEDMWHAPQGVHDLLQAQFYFKSANWKGNRPHALKAWTATELAKMPEYYIMDLDKTIAETMAAKMPTKEQIAACKWMTDKDLQVYSAEFVRTGFQGGLNSYRVLADSRYDAELYHYSGRTIDVPACFIAGASEWGPYQSPGVFEAMQHGACTRLLGVHLVNGAGHSVVEEQPEKVTNLLIEFLEKAGAT